jgi:hypothetical protein
MHVPEDHAQQADKAIVFPVVIFRSDSMLSMILLSPVESVSSARDWPCCELKMLVRGRCRVVSIVCENS